ncbi:MULTISPECIES: hypothetical protein [Streptomyces]|uniref:Uncharacterized protein n=2 Tax=Streptomyces TaxID=1883 RepID=A0ACC4W359_STRFR|nr:MULTISPECIES: hypothetical protein [Streptomyces]KNE79074.1 hypothetical protein ADZ36_29650 [Streptomyces fradiae]OFA34121.1 hypothetical protein BEN35_30910 [Streptomyces fradiae]
MVLRLEAGLAVALVTGQLVELAGAAAGNPGVAGPLLLPVSGTGWEYVLLVPVPFLVLIAVVVAAPRRPAAAVTVVPRARPGPRGGVSASSARAPVKLPGVSAPLSTGCRMTGCGAPPHDAAERHGAGAWQAPEASGGFPCRPAPGPARTGGRLQSSRAAP